MNTFRLQNIRNKACDYDDDMESRSLNFNWHEPINKNQIQIIIGQANKQQRKGAALVQTATNKLVHSPVNGIGCVLQ